MLQSIPLTDEEKAAVEEEPSYSTNSAKRLEDSPTPAGPRRGSRRTPATGGSYCAYFRPNFQLLPFAFGSSRINEHIGLFSSLENAKAHCFREAGFPY